MDANDNITSARQMKDNTHFALSAFEEIQKEKDNARRKSAAAKRDKLIMMVFLFAIAATGIALIFPTVGKFRYDYEYDKPWQYEDLTAPINFSINKSENEINNEYKILIVDEFTPYYSTNDSIGRKMLASLYSRLSESDDLKDVCRYAYSKLEESYNVGVISADEKLNVSKLGVTKIKIKRSNDGNSAYEESDISNFKTTKEVYELIINEAPSSISKDLLRELNLNEFITDNMVYEEVASEHLLKEIRKQISTTKGIVQEGQKIVSKGELVSMKQIEILDSLKDAYESQTGKSTSNNVLLGQICCIVCVLTAFFLYMILFRERFISFNNVFFMLGLIVSICALTSFALRMSRDIEAVSVYLVPYALIPIIISSFFDTRTALFTHLTAVLLCSLIVPNEFEFLLLQTIIGMICISTLKHLYQRSQLIKTASIMVLVYIFTYVGLTFIRNGSWDKQDTVVMFSFIINGGLLLFAYPFIYIIEKIFGFISDVTLIELTNTNTPLLRQLSESAPGTFNHSMQVANLASDAAVAVNANQMLARAGAMYHDIGKMANPIFFTENQHGFNPHSFLSEKESVGYILRHVTDGLSISRKNGLPKQIQEFIETHHGQNVVRSFYNQYCNKHPEENVNEKDFAYPGKLPNSKETVIVMICDSVEAASRSLSNHTNESISNLVDNIVKGHLQSGAFNDAPITLKEIETVKNTLKEDLMNVYHTRVKYPELIKKKE